MEYFGKASTSKETTEEKQAEEKLKLVLIELGMDKRTDTTYNENSYIDNRINEQEGMTVLEGDIVSVDGWKFEIDRSVPKIGKSLGKLQTGTYLQGGIVGNDTNRKMQASNNYWLDICGASVGSGNPSGNTNAVKKTEAQMKALATTLGDAYTNDIQNEDGTWKYNDGYPILVWQIEK